jgi:phage-related protein
MAQPLSLASAVDKNSIDSQTPWLICLEVDLIDFDTGASFGTGYFVRNTEDLVFNGNTYIKTSFDINVKNDAGGQPSVTITINDYTGTFQSYMQQYGGGVGSNCRIIVVNSGNLDAGIEVIEYFKIVGASANNYVATLTLGAENSLSIIFPRRRQFHGRCGWRYMSAECGYVGALTTCDLSLAGPNGCEAHLNQARYGGFPGINSNGMRYA